MSFISPQPCGSGGCSCCPVIVDGVCLADGTPIAIVYEGTILQGWVNQLTGTFTPGPPPPGTGTCSANRFLDCDTDSVTICTDGPIPVTGQIDVTITGIELSCDTSSVTICPGDDPIPVTGVGQFDIRPLDCDTDSVTICADSPIPVSGTFSVDFNAIEQEIMCEFDECGEVSRRLLVIRIFDTDGIPVGLPLYYDTLDNSPVAVTGTLFQCPTQTFSCDPVVVCPGTEAIPVIVKLTCEEDSVTVCPGDEPLNVNIVSGGGGTVTVDFSYPEDSPHVSGNIGAFVLAVRNDANAVLTSANGDYSPFSVTSTGALNIADAGGSITVDGTVTVLQGTSPWIVSGTVTADTNFDYPEDSPHVSGDIGAFTLGVRNDANAVLTSANGDYSPFSVTSTGALNIADAGGSITVDGTVTVLQGTSPWVVSGTVTSVGTKTFTDAYANPTDDIDVIALTGGFNGTTWDRQRSTGDNADGVAVATLGEAIVIDRNTVFNGTTWDRMRSGTATGSVLVNNPTAANLLATVTTAYQYAEDSGHVSGNIGAFVLAVRNDTGAVLAGTDLDYIPFTTDATGALRVTGSATIAGGTKTFTDAYANPTDNIDTISRNTVFNGTTWDRMRSGTATGSVLVNNPTAANLLATVTTAYQYAEDSGHVSGNIGAFVLAVRNDTGAVLAGTDLDYIPFTTDATGALRVTAGTTTITGTVAGTHTFTDAYANPTDDIDVIALTGGFNGTTWDRARSTGDNADGVAVATLGELIVVDRNTIFNGTTWDRWRTAPGVTGAGAIGGPTAADGVLAVAPVTIGGRASTVVPTDVSTDGDVVNLWTEKSGRLRVFNSRRNRSGIYHATTPLSTVTLAADAATGGRWWLVVNTGATTFAAIRRIAFTSQSATALVTLTTPIFTVERFTTTTNPTGAQITPAKRDSTDAANTATFRTANTGMTITAGAAAEGFVTHSVLTAIGSVPVNKQQWPREGTDEEEFLVLRAGEGVVIRQSTAGTLADTRTVQIDIIWEEWS